MQRYGGLVVLCLLTACFEGTPTRATPEFSTSVPLMNCEQLTSELVYQVRVLDGIQKTETHETSAGRAAATVLTLGYNMASQYNEDDARSERAALVQQHINLLTDARENKKCDN